MESHIPKRWTNQRDDNKQQGIITYRVSYIYSRSGYFKVPDIGNKMTTNYFNELYRSQC